MNEHWTETLEKMTREELMRFVMIAIGMLSKNWIYENEQNLFDLILSLVRKEKS